jgi:L-aminoadipate-semialdehyde dehydrogenase
MPLYHFVTADIPSNTKAPELDDTNAVAAVRSDKTWSGQDASSRSGVTEDLMGIYLSYLVEIGFLPPPLKGGSRFLPTANISNTQKTALSSVGGRGGLT